MMAMVSAKVRRSSCMAVESCPGRLRARSDDRDVFEGVGATQCRQPLQARNAELEGLRACPSRLCGGLFTANTMAGVSEASAWQCPARPARGSLRFARRLCRGIGAGGHGAAEHANPDARHVTGRRSRKRATISPRPAARKWSVPLPAIANEDGIEFSCMISARSRSEPRYTRIEAGGRY